MVRCCVRRSTFACRALRRGRRLFLPHFTGGTAAQIACDVFTTGRCDSPPVLSLPLPSLSLSLLHPPARS
eukprot:COSAG01_NODE_7349_length_3241_cov_27.885742_3_plen_70_part_00